MGTAPFRIDGQSMQPWTDQERNRAGNEANMAFGTAWLAVHDVTEIAADIPKLSNEAQALLAEMKLSEAQLLDLFKAGAFAAVCELALSIVVLAERVSMLLE
jgi:hypothetical protein